MPIKPIEKKDGMPLQTMSWIDKFNEVIEWANKHDELTISRFESELAELIKISEPLQEVIIESIGKRALNAELDPTIVRSGTYNPLEDYIIPNEKRIVLQGEPLAFTKLQHAESELEKAIEDFLASETNYWADEKPEGMDPIKKAFENWKKCRGKGE